jgi:KUP system potassium uptake protein
MKTQTPGAASNRLWTASLGAIGVVYGDIGTSPLYAFKESVAAAGGANAGMDAVLGVLSLIIWSLIFVVSIKYMVVILKADNDGEGGILSLMALAQRSRKNSHPLVARIIGLGILGAALFFCDALITPAISVLSAVEGVALLNPDLEQLIVPATIAIIIGLFLIQQFGTHLVSRFFSPVMILWFLCLGALGFYHLIQEPRVLLAVNPVYGVKLLLTNPGLASAILGAVFLTLTGAEALYSDMGHFGRKPVRLAWFCFVWPALLLNYLGQGALVIGNPAMLSNPFYGLVPVAFLPALIALATTATVIASQAVITGAYSATRQAVQLDLLPRVVILQTSERERGQIYVPLTNFLMCLAVIAFVLLFRSSSGLSAAYGVAVVGDMLITTMLGALVALASWHWSVWRVAGVFIFFLLIDLVFLVGNLSKIMAGGWTTLCLAAILYMVFAIWRDGRIRLRAELERRAVPCSELPDLIRTAVKVPGTAVYLVSNADFVPTAMLRNLEHNHVVHASVIFLNLEIVRTPRFDPDDRLVITEVIPDVFAIRARFGFLERPDVRAALTAAHKKGINVDIEQASYFTGWHLVRAIPRKGLRGLEMKVFGWLQRRSAQAAEFFGMPTKRVVVLATNIEL